MHIFRTFFYLLLAGNIALAALSAMGLAGLNQPWQPVGETERLRRQLTPEKIVLISENPATATDAPANAPAAAVATSTSASSAAASVAASSSAPAATCLAFTRLSGKDVDQIRELAATLGDQVKLQVNGLQPSSYWVNIPPSGGRDEANRRGEVLARAGITDYIIVREAGPNQYAVSLGLFRNEDAARRLIEQLQKKNIKTARITVRDNTGNGARTEIRAPATVLQVLSEQIRGQLKSIETDECRRAG